MMVVVVVGCPAAVLLLPSNMMQRCRVSRMDRLENCTYLTGVST